MMSPEQSGRERIFICERAVNLRKSFDGLSGVVEGIMGEDPEAGDLFVFFNRTRRLIKVLQWQGDGFAIWMKRLEQGSFHLPEPKGDRAKIEFNAREFAAILNGIKPEKYYKRYFRKKN